MNINEQGWIEHNGVMIDPIPGLGHVTMSQPINAIVLHRTAWTNAMDTIRGWKNGGNPNGTHFIITECGNIRQHVSLLKSTWHMGRVRARCLKTRTCSKADLKKYKEIREGAGTLKSKQVAVKNYERANKAYPERYPMNDDSVGIEIVGHTATYNDIGTYPKPPYQVMQAVDWLVTALMALLDLDTVDLYAHAAVAHKNHSEAIATLNDFIRRLGK